MVLIISARSQAITLEEANSLAAGNSHEIKELELQTESMGWGEKKAFAGFLPTLDFKTQHSFAEHYEELELPFNGADVVIPSIAPYTTFGLEAQISVFSGFSTVNEVSAAQAAHEAYSHKLSREQEKVRASTRTLFYRALGSQILVEVADQNIQTLQGHLGDVNSRVRSGVSTRFDTLRAEVLLEDAQTQKLGADNDVAVARAKLFQALAVADDGKPLVGKLPEDFSKYTAGKLSLQDIKRQDRDAQLAKIRQGEALMKAAAAHWYPKISLYGTYEAYNNYNHSIWEDDQHFKSASGLGLLLKWNLFDGGAMVASQHQASLAKQMAAEQLAILDDATPVELEESQRRFTYDLTTYKAKLSSVRKAEEAVRLARGGMRAGTRTNTDVLDAVVDLNRARAASVKSQIDAVEALGQLELAIGHQI